MVYYLASTLRKAELGSGIFFKKTEYETIIKLNKLELQLKKSRYR